MQDAWHVLEPSTVFVPGWHIDAICEHLEACSRSDIRNLIVNIPPRSMKSLLISVLWFAWTWTHRPETRWLCSSYADSLSIRDSLKCRRLIQSPWYAAHFGSAFTLTGDQNQKTRFENDRTGYRLATGVGGVATGEGGEYLIADDPHKVQEGESDTVRESAVTWWLETMSTRGNDPKSAVRVIVMQRVHERDLTGEVLARELGYDHLCLPMRYEPEAAKVTSIGFQDPRTTDGELLWPERFSEEDVTTLERNLGSYAAAGQLQQRPAPRGGSMLQRAWFEIVDAAPANASRVRYWDKAGTAGGTGARSAGALLAKANRVFYVEDIIADRWASVEREKVIRQTAELDRMQRGAVDTWAEQEPGSGGKESAESTIANLAGFAVYAERVTGDKVSRAEPFAVQAEAGNVKLVRGDWNIAFLEEAEKFPKGALKDQVDACSGALNKLALVPDPEPPRAGGQRGYLPVANTHLGIRPGMEYRP